LLFSLLPRLAALGNMAGYSVGSYAALRGIKITPAGLSGQAQTDKLS
jgi:hypothetical protein